MRRSVPTQVPEAQPAAYETRIGLTKTHATSGAKSLDMGVNERLTTRTSEFRESSMGAAPRASIIMALYKGEAYVAQAVESVLAQTCADWELICVDDASPDRSADVVAEYAAHDPRIRLLRNETNLGQCVARNRAAAAATANFIANLDQDDIALPDRLERSLAVLEADPSLAAVGSGAIGIDERGRFKRVKSVPIRVTDQFPLLFFNSSLMIRKEVFERVGGYDPLFAGCEDYDLCLRLLRQHKIGVLDPPLICYRDHDAQDYLRKRKRIALLGEVLAAREAALRHELPFDVYSEIGKLERDEAFQASLSYKRAVELLKRAKPREAREEFRSLLASGHFSPEMLPWYLVCLLPEPILRVAKTLRGGLRTVTLGPLLRKCPTVRVWSSPVSLL